MSSLINWVYSNIKFVTTGAGLWLLHTTGLYTKKAKVLLLGLDNAGKTTLLGMLANNTISCHSPTMHPNNEEFVFGNIQFNAHDLGGHAAARRLWQSYSASVDSIIFLVDTTDYERMAECRSELSKLLASLQQEIPVLILGNKTDSQNSCSAQQLCQYLDIDSTNGNIGVFMCSVVKRFGIEPGFKWLSNKL